MVREVRQVWPLVIVRDDFGLLTQRCLLHPDRVVNKYEFLCISISILIYNTASGGSTATCPPR